MNTVEHFLQQFDYDFWANRRALASIEAAMPLPDKVVSLYSHILAAEEIWHARLTAGDSSRIPVWPERLLAECRALTSEVNRNWQTYLASLSTSSLQATVVYRDTRGTRFETPRHQILSHVVIHGGHHRGQIAHLLRQAGNSPAVTDFIAYTRI